MREYLIIHIIRKALLSMLTEYPTTLEHDMKTYKEVKNQSLTKHHALILRISEKKILLSQMNLLRVTLRIHVITSENGFCKVIKSNNKPIYLVLLLPERTKALL